MNARSRHSLALAARLRQAMYFTALLWLPAILSDALSPFTLRHIVVAAPLRTLFALTVTVGVCASLITATVAALGSLLLHGRETDAEDAELVVMAMAGFFAATLIVSPFLHSVPATSGLPLSVALPVIVLLAGAVTVLVSYVCPLGLRALGVRRPLRTTALLSILLWLVVFLYQFSIHLFEPRLLVALLAGFAAAFMVSPAYGPHFEGRPHVYFCYAVLGPILVTLLAPVVGPGTARTEPANAAPPTSAKNVLIILIDTLRADSITPGGAPPSETPFLTELASQPRATYFSKATAAAPSTVPSVKALFTGQMPSTWGLRATNTPPAADVITLPKAFARSGYATSLVSANPLIDCEEFGAETDSCWSAGGYRYFLKSFLLNDLWSGNRVWEGFERVDRLRVHNIDGRVVLDLMRKWLDTRPTSKPFFAYVHLIDPHWPYLTNASSDPPAPDDDYSYVPFLRLNHGNPENAQLRTGPALAALRSRYGRQVQHVDSLLREFIRFIDARNLRSNTLVILVGDHGEEFLEHNGFGHGHDVFEEQVHVPLLVLWPDDVSLPNVSQSVDASVSLLDVVPTIEDLCDVHVSSAEPGGGTSLLQFVRGDPPKSRTPVLSEAFSPGRSYLSYRENDWKLRVRFDESTPPASSPNVLAFNLTEDPTESHPVGVLDPNVRDLVARARQYLGEVGAVTPR